jgi:hypothetical protein
MQPTRFDFDVITGPARPLQPPRPELAKADPRTTPETVAISAVPRHKAR